MHSKQAIYTADYARYVQYWTVVLHQEIKSISRITMLYYYTVKKKVELDDTSYLHQFVLRFRNFKFKAALSQTF